MAGEEVAPAAAAESLDAQAIQQVADAAGRLRTTARWTVGAVGAVATAIATGFTITGLEDLDDWRFAVGAAGLALVVLGAGVVIIAVARVLAPKNIPLEQASGPSITTEMLLGEINTGAFAQRLLEVETQRLAALDRVTVPANDTVLPYAVERAGIYSARAERIRLIALFNALQRTWSKARAAIAIGMALVVVGVVGYELAAAEQKTAPIRQPDTSAAPELSIDFTAGAVPGAISPACATDRRGFEIAEHGKDTRLLLVIGKGADCPGVFVRVPTSQVTAREVAATAVTAPAAEEKAPASDAKTTTTP